MTEIRKTFSICNECYKKIPATIVLTDTVVELHKECCGLLQKEVIEKNKEFYNAMVNAPYNNILGNLCNIAITDDCNSTCKACYCKIEKKEKSLDEIMGMSFILPTWIDKIMLTGGEPTIHSQFFDIVSNLNCGVITNGIKFADLNFLKEFAQFNVYMAGTNNEIATMFSLNTEDSPDYGEKMLAIENFKRMGLKLAMVSSTITDLDEIPGVLSEFRKIKDVVSTFKIRSAFNIGESQGFKHIYISELIKKVKENCGILRFVQGMHTNTYLVNMRCDDIHLMLVKCPDKTIIDLCDIGPTGPYQLTHLNTFEDVVVALIVNEGIEKGWFNGRKIND